MNLHDHILEALADHRSRNVAEIAWMVKGVCGGIDSDVPRALNDLAERGEIEKVGDEWRLLRKVDGRQKELF